MMLSDGTNTPKFHLANPITRSKQWLNVFRKSGSVVKKVPKEAIKRTCKAKEE